MFMFLFTIFAVDLLKNLFVHRSDLFSSASLLDFLGSFGLIRFGSLLLFAFLPFGYLSCNIDVATVREMQEVSVAVEGREDLPRSC